MVTPFSSAIWRKRSEIGNSTVMECAGRCRGCLRRRPD